MACNTGTPGGAVACIEKYGAPLMFGISELKNKYASIGAAQSIESVRAYVEEDGTMIMTKAIENVENTRPELVTEENGLGKVTPNITKPGGTIVHLTSNPDDFTEWVKAYTGGTYYLEMFFNNKHKLLVRNDDGTLSGLKANVTAVAVGTPEMQTTLDQYRLYINWDNSQQWKNTVLVPIIDEITDYDELNPLGWNYEFSGTYATSTQSIKVWDRGNINSLMTETPTVTITGSNVDTPAVSAGAPTLGISDLTITKEGVPVALVAGDYIEFELHDKDGNVIVKTTSNILFNAIKRLP